MSSTTGSGAGRFKTISGGLMAGSALSARTSPPSARSWHRCRPTSSIPVWCWTREWTGPQWSPCGWWSTRCQHGSSVGGSGFHCGHPKLWCSTAARWRPGTSGLLPRAGSRSSWTIIWRSSRPSPALCLVPLLWPGRGSRVLSPAPMTPSGLPRAGSTVMPRGPVNWLTSCCCTDRWKPKTSRQGSPQPLE